MRQYIIYPQTPFIQQLEIKVIRQSANNVIGIGKQHRLLRLTFHLGVPIQLPQRMSNVRINT